MLYCSNCNIKYYTDQPESLCYMCKWTQSIKPDIPCQTCNAPSGPQCSNCLFSTIINKIDDQVYLSDCVAARQYSYLHHCGIKQILSIGAELQEHETLDFNLLHIKIHDHEDVQIKDYFDQAYHFINKAPTLVHCYAGISRSATIVIAYLMKKYQMPFDTAFSVCKNMRPMIMPNPGFIKQLQEYNI